MITATDTSILFDVLIPGARNAEQSERLLCEAVRTGALIINEAVYAELAAQFPNASALDDFLARGHITLRSSSPEALYQAGRAWRQYTERRRRAVECPGCGNPHALSCATCGQDLSLRQHVLSDFLIGAHALVHADRLLSRDRGYYATYFPRLAVHCGRT